MTPALHATTPTWTSEPPNGGDPWNQGQAALNHYPATACPTAVACSAGSAGGDDVSWTETEMSPDYDGVPKVNPNLYGLSKAEADLHYWQTYKTARRNYRAHYNRPTRSISHFLQRRSQGKD